MSVTSILIVGVGGQGSLLTSRILGSLALELDLDVKVSEVHGMAQRGGSVVTYVRMGENVASPIIDEGGADYMLAFEALEALRYVQLLKEDGQIVANTQQIDPMPVITGAAEYPVDVQQQLTNAAVTHFVDAVPVANDMGNIRVVNTIMLGKLAHIMGTEKQKWMDAIQACVPQKTIDINVEAFERGYNL